VIHVAAQNDACDGAIRHAIPSRTESEFHIVRFAAGFSVILFLVPESMFYMAKRVVYLIEK
jgi:hypothetical protein